jgi:hypothetical protein
MIKYITICLVLIGLTFLTPLGVFSQSPNTIEIETEKALLAAWNDTKQAQLIYQTVIYRFGKTQPFVTILREERQHEEMIMSLLVKYGVEIPKESMELKNYTAKNLTEAYNLAIEKEKASIALYEKYIKVVKLPCVWHTFSYIKNESKEKHLPAFQRRLAELEQKKVLS